MSVELQLKLDSSVAAPHRRHLHHAHAMHGVQTWRMDERADCYRAVQCALGMPAHLRATLRSPPVPFKLTCKNMRHARV